MTKLDQSFIKAYGQEQGLTAPALATALEPAPGQCSAPPKSHLRFPARGGEKARPAQLTSAEPNWIETTTAIAMSPSGADIFRADTLCEPRREQTRPMVTAPSKPVQRTAVPLRPTAGPNLSHRACTLETSAPPLPAPTEKVEPASGVAYQPFAKAPDASLRPAFEVDAFRWPTIITDIGQRATTALANLIDELVSASSEGHGIIMFASQRRGAGTTTLALYAARRVAELGLSVAVVDADFARPAAARMLGIAPEHGWEDVLADRCSLADCLISSLADRVALLPLRASCQDLAVSRAALAAVHLDQLRRNYDLVLVDGGLAAENAERWLLAAGDDAVDATIIVRDVRRDGPGAVERISIRSPERNEFRSTRSLGVIDNFVQD